MLFFHILLALFLPTYPGTKAASVSAYPQCEPFHSTFPASDISRSGINTPFEVLSPEDSYAINEDGLVLYMEKPKGKIETKDGVNNIVAEGATVNSTFTLLYGKVTFEVTAPAVAGAVTAAILIADQHDEIDVELLGGDPAHWQTNIFTASPKDQQPLWGVFGDIEGFPSTSHANADIEITHNYTIDWSSSRIIWSVDGHHVRTLQKSDTRVNGTLHYPSHPTRVQLGIWDASNPAGTSEWARGPIDWNSAPRRMSATFKSLTVEC